MFKNIYKLTDFTVRNEARRDLTRITRMVQNIEHLAADPNLFSKLKFEYFAECID